jgi:hypothetical protein
MAINGLGVVFDRTPTDPGTFDHCLAASKWLKLT